MRESEGVGAHLDHQLMDTLAHLLRVRREAEVAGPPEVNESAEVADADAEGEAVDAVVSERMTLATNTSEPEGTGSHGESVLDGIKHTLAGEGKELLRRSPRKSQTSPLQHSSITVILYCTTNCVPCTCTFARGALW